MDSYRFKKRMEVLKGVKRGEMSEREYYTILVKLLYSFGDNPKLTPNQREELRKAFIESGAQTYDEWEAEKKKNGEEVDREGSLYDECVHGDIRAGVSYVSTIIGCPDDMDFSLSFMNDGGSEHSWAGKWIRASERILERERKEDELLGLMERDRKANEEKKNREGQDKKSPNDDGEEPADD